MDWESSYNSNGRIIGKKRHFSEQTNISKHPHKIAIASDKLANEIIQKDQKIQKLKLELKDLKLKYEQIQYKLMKTDNDFGAIRMYLIQNIKKQGLSNQDRSYWQSQFKLFVSDHNKMKTKMMR